jgi:signal transduction histidine kinase
MAHPYSRSRGLRRVVAAEGAAAIRVAFGRPVAPGAPSHLLDVLEHFRVCVGPRSCRDQCVDGRDMIFDSVGTCVPGEPERLPENRSAVLVPRLALTNIDREATRLTHLVDNLLRFSGTETASTQLRLEPIDLGPVIETTVRVFSELIDPADAMVVTVVEVEAEVLADVDALGRVLLNLLENAVKYGTAGQTVRVGLTTVHDYAVITVDDDGPGVEPSERHSIWEPFSRGVNAVRGAAAGSGIGLSVVREIITGHGGFARVLDAPGGGARFELRLPLTESLPRSRQPDTRQAHV